MSENETPEAPATESDKAAQARLKAAQKKLKEGETAELTIHGNVIINR